MKTIRACIFYSIFPVMFQPLWAQPADRVENLNLDPALEAPKPEAFDGPIIQLALLLDTSNSMDGLIDQARSRLWKIVNVMVEAEVEGKKPQLQVALFQYGNSRLSADEDFVQLRSPFTTDLDVISEQLFSLSTSGGSEYCGAVLRESLSRLDWLGTERDNVLRVIVVAGNEPFNQGTEPYEEWTANARQREVIVNTIFCGNMKEGERTLWADGAKRGGGEFAAIEQNQTEMYIPTPFDDELKKLNDALNGTYLGVGDLGRAAKSRQVEQDAMNQRSSGWGFYSRIRSKSSRNYNAASASWDLVTAVQNGDVKLEDIAKEDLPEDLAKMSLPELEKHIAELASERARIEKEITQASAKRDRFLVEEAKGAETDQDLDDALIGSIKKQAESEGFIFP